MPRIAEPLRDRIARFVEVDPATGCWLWQGAKNESGYGRMAVPTGKMGGRTDYTHRVAYEEYVGPIPDGMLLDHLCRTASCCNPEHLEPVTQQENLRRGVGYGKTHCKHHHEFTPENTRITPRGRRCIACERRRSQESSARKKNTTPTT